MTKACFLCLGGNEGDRLQLLRESLTAIERQVGQITAISSVYETAPWGMTGPDFLNQVVRVMTLLDAESVLTEIHAIERSLGRARTGTGYQSRPVDIDLLFFGNELIRTPRLEVPHPHLEKRKFVLVPLSEIAPGFVHPALGLTVTELLDRCTDGTAVRQIQ